jgi:hypothetical protein
MDVPLSRSQARVTGNRSGPLDANARRDMGQVGVAEVMEADERQPRAVAESVERMHDCRPGQCATWTLLARAPRRAAQLRRSAVYEAERAPSVGVH